MNFVPTNLYNSVAYFYAGTSLSLGNYSKPPVKSVLALVDYSKVTPSITVDDASFALDIGTQPPLMVGVSSVTGNVLSFVLSGGDAGATYVLTINATYLGAAVRTDTLIVDVPTSGDACAQPLVGSGVTTGATVILNSGIRLFIGTNAPIGAQPLDQWYDPALDIISELVFDGTNYFWHSLATQGNLSTFLPLSGGTMTGELVVLTPVNPGDAANKNYVDTALTAANYVHRAGDTMTGNLTISDAAPALTINKTTANTSALLFGTSSGLACWSIDLAALTGNDFSINRYDNQGNSLGSAFSILASTGIATFAFSPTAPTPTVGDSSTKVATTAFVQDTGNAIAANYLPLAGGQLTGTLQLGGPGGAASNFMLQHNADDNRVLYFTNNAYTYYNPPNNVMHWVVSGAEVMYASNNFVQITGTLRVCNFGDFQMYWDGTNRCLELSGNGGFDGLVYSYSSNRVALICNGAWGLQMDGAGNQFTYSIYSSGTMQAAWLHSTGNINADADIGCRSLYASSIVQCWDIHMGGGNNNQGTIWGLQGIFSGTVQGGYVHSTGSVQADGNVTIYGGLVFPTYYGGHSYRLGWTGSGVRLGIDGGDTGYLPYSSNIKTFSWSGAGTINYTHDGGGGSGWWQVFGSLRELEEHKEAVARVPELLSRIAQLEARLAQFDDARVALLETRLARLEGR